MSQQTNKQNKKPTVKPDQNKQPKKGFGWWAYVLMGILLLSLLFTGDGKFSKNISYTQFTAYIEHGAVDKLVVFDDNKTQATINEENYALVFGSKEFTVVHDTHPVAEVLYHRKVMGYEQHGAAVFPVAMT